MCILLNNELSSRVANLFDFLAIFIVICSISKWLRGAVCGGSYISEENMWCSGQTMFQMWNVKVITDRKTLFASDIKSVKKPSNFSKDIIHKLWITSTRS